MSVITYKRRVKKATEYTRYIALPPDWLRHNGIGAGDEVIMELTKKGELLIKPKREAIPEVRS